MALNMDAIGKKIGPLKKEYDWKDVILYALGVGAGVDELDYTYEKNLKVIPSFSIASIFNFLGELGVGDRVRREHDDAHVSSRARARTRVERRRRGGRLRLHHHQRVSRRSLPRTPSKTIRPIRQGPYAPVDQTTR